MIDKLSETLKFHQTALGLRAQRQQVLASNVANADTPHFKAQDFEFRGALQAAMGGAASALPMARTVAGHLAGRAGADGGVEMKYRQETQSSVDGNTVDLDVERGQFAQNSVHYEASVSFVNHLLRSLQQSMQGQ